MAQVDATGNVVSAPAPTLNLNTPPPDTQFLGGSVSQLPGYVPPDSGRVLQPWQVEDRNSYLQAQKLIAQQQAQQMAAAQQQMAIQQATGGNPGGISNDLSSVQVSPAMSQDDATNLLGYLESKRIYGNSQVERDYYNRAYQNVTSQLPSAVVKQAEDAIRHNKNITGNEFALGDILNRNLGALSTVGKQIGQKVGANPSILGPEGFLFNAIPQGIRQKVGGIAGEFAGPGLADVATGGALTPLFTAQAGQQAIQISRAYEQGQISGKDALIGLAQTAPQLIPALLHGGGKLAEYARSDEGQTALQGALRPPNVAYAMPPEPGPESAPSPVGDNSPAPPQAGTPLNPEQYQRIPSLETQMARSAAGQIPVNAPGALGRPDIVQGISEKANPAVIGGQDPVSAFYDRIQARNDAAQARAEMQQNRSDLQAARTAQEEVYTRQAATQVREKALALGAKPADAELLGKQMQLNAMADLHNTPLNGTPPLSDRIASWVEGTQPGIVGDMSLNMKDFGGALGITRGEWLNRNLKPIVAAVEKDVPNLKYVGDPAKAPHLDELSSAGRAGYAIVHPNEFLGWSKDARRAINVLMSQSSSRYAIARALDPTLPEPVGGNYLMRVYERPGSETMQPLVRPRGEVSVFKERQFKDEWQAFNNGYRFKQMPLTELITRAMQATDQGSQDAMLKRDVLGRFGTRDAAKAKAEKMVAVPGGAFPGDTKGWYLPPDVINRVQQVYEPNQLAQSRPVRSLSSIGKTAITFPLDVGGLAVRLAEIAVTQPHNLAAGFVNELLRDPAGVFSDYNLSRAVNLRSEGIQMGAAGSALENARLPGRVGEVAADLNHATWGTTLGQARGLAYEGNLALKRLLGRDISLQTEEGVAQRANSRDTVNAFSGASRGAGNLGRQQVESRSLLSSQTTRAMAAQFGQAAKLLSPTASLSARLNAAATIAAAGSSIWALQTVANLAQGKHVRGFQFPVTYQGGKFSYNSKWATITHGATVFPILRQQTYINAMAQAFTVLANQGKNGDWLAAIKSGDLSGFAPNLGNIIAPEAKTALGRLGPIPRAGLAALGYGFDPNTGASLGNLNPTQRLMQAVPLPIPLSNAFSKRPGSIGEFALEQATGSYPLSPYDRYDQALKAHGIAAGVKATPADQYNARQQFPDVAAAYDARQQATQQRGGDSATYDNAAKDATTQQLASDAALTSQQMTGQQWKDAYHQRQSNLQFLRDHLNLGSASNQPKVVKDYQAVFDKYPNADTDPAQKQALYDALDQYTAGLSTADQTTLDKYIGWGAGTTPVVREYRATVQGLQKAGVYDIEPKLLAQLGFGKFKTVGDIVNSVVDQIMQGTQKSQQSPALRQLITNKVSSRFNKLDQLVNVYKLNLIQNDPQLEAEAVKFGLMQSKEALAMSLAAGNAQ